MAFRRGWVGIASAILAMGCADGASPGSSAPLEAVCTEDAATVPDGGWVCPDSFTVECDNGDGTANVDTIYVVAAVPDAGPGCGDGALAVNDPGPFTLGEHTIVVSVPTDVAADAGADAGTPGLCQATLTVVDTEAPQVTEHQVKLWPPNHSMHEVTPEDCVTVEDRCHGPIDAHFTWARCDEPEDDVGDGHHQPDIEFGDKSVQVRSERQGGGDGRVYRLGYEAEDGDGNVVEGSCTVVVPHDQSGREAMEGPPAYEVMATP